MQDPRGLFEFAESVPDLGQPVLVQAMEGFVDAGGAARLARAHLLETMRSELIVTFDVDQLFDYRGRRPEMIFATDHWESFAAPQLAIHAVWDSAGVPFLLLDGPEPDFQWERFVAAVELIIETFDVRLLVGLNAIPMNVPHTRPTAVIAHGSPIELIAGYTNWLGTVQVPASAGHLLEFRMAQAGFNSMGFAVNVPHYLANVDYPQAAITLLDCIATSGELMIPTEALTEASAAVLSNIDAQVSASEEIAGVVRALEKQYDEITAGRANSLLADGSRLPTADEIGDEFEQYLLRQPGSGENPETL
ncbi:PAC2 family protein [Jatrophihabitans sp. GAS493]|uniref:PAC2 family protein n=1 Tax=Jatrophihabitans sp. GAS493 TaxID=1907575 RepID=UPI000BB714FA|nr:PAC2 family protein [Jatrophihabitans sp. GAS493]SOD71475.1 PAC2 family protein [Jatrophihabitans sp. GAS493]